MNLRSYFLIITLLPMLCLQSQEPQKVTTYYEKGQLKEEYQILNNDSSKVDGEYKMYDLMGNVIVTGFFERGRRNGTFKNYYADGSLQRITDYKNNLRQGIARIYAINGTIIQEAVFENDTLVGEIKLFDQEGRTKSTTTFKNGLPNGAVLDYYENGNVKEEVTYKNGKPNGWTKHYHENGNLKLEAEYVNGLLNGLYKTYYSTGQLEMEILNERGKKSGTLKTYYTNGQLKSTGIYEKGGLQGDFLSYYSDGSIKNKFSYKDGYQSGKNLEYYDSGQIKTESNYSSDGQDVAIRDFSVRGGLISQKFLKNNLPDGTWTIWDDNGDLKRTENYRKGKLEGIKTEYDKGKKITKTHYLQGRKSGEAFEYSLDGTVCVSKTHKLDKLHGPFAKYYKNGKIKYEGKYVQNKRNGLWKFFDKEGNLKEKLIYEMGEKLSNESY
ncbi:MAG: hypothetical protein OXH57_05520 [Ekhidna sp.]|nr:hypothetical protein [Ekhidna sp.]